MGYMYFVCPVKLKNNWRHLIETHCDVTSTPDERTMRERMKGCCGVTFPDCVDLDQKGNGLFFQRGVDSVRVSCSFDDELQI